MTPQAVVPTAKAHLYARPGKEELVNLEIVLEAIPKSKCFVVSVRCEGMADDAEPLHASTVDIPDVSPSSMLGRIVGGGAPAWLGKTLKAAIIDPALKAADLPSATVKVVRVNDQQVVGTEETRLFAELNWQVRNLPASPHNLPRSTPTLLACTSFSHTLLVCVAGFAGD